MATTCWILPKLPNDLDPGQPSGVTIEATDADGANNNVIEFSINCDYGEQDYNFGFEIDENSGELRINNTIGEIENDFDCTIFVCALDQWSYYLYFLVKCTYDIF